MNIKEQLEKLYNTSEWEVLQTIHNKKPIGGDIDFLHNLSDKIAVRMLIILQAEPVEEKVVGKISEAQRLSMEMCGVEEKQKIEPLDFSDIKTYYEKEDVASAIFYFKDKINEIIEKYGK